MNSFGKWLILFNVLASIAFMTLAMSVYANHTQWNVKAKTLETDNRDKQTRIDNLTSELNTLQQTVEQERNQLNGQIASLETEKDEFRRELERLSAQEAQLRQSERESVALAQASQNTLADLRQQVDQLRTGIRDAELAQDQSFNEMVKKTDEFYNVQGQLSRLESTNRELVGRLAKTSLILEQHDLDENVPLDGIPPKVHGLITDARDNGYVTMSIGSDDGVRPGNTVEVFRNDKYVGRVEILKTATDTSVGKVLRQFQRAPIRIQDNVATRLN
ncbi:MAG: hypothetical protein R3C10_01190 [Pirellulales bacterium]|nr:hypothetical protein [Planctomycetales bacterium]